MKLYIVGPVGSGKTTLARQLSKENRHPPFSFGPGSPPTRPRIQDWQSETSGS